jgi:hypothetical protein
MCMGKVIVMGSGTDPREISDVVDITTDGSTVKILTLFGEEHRFSDVAIDHVAMNAGVVISLIPAAPQ